MPLAVPSTVTTKLSLLLSIVMGNPAEGTVAAISPLVASDETATAYYPLAVVVVKPATDMPLPAEGLAK